MGISKSFRQLAAWIAFLGILAAALIPSINHAMAKRANGAGWAEICSADGVKVVKLAEGKDAASSQPLEKESTHEHCSYCLTSVGPADLAQQAPLAVLSIAQPSQHPSLFYQSPRPLFVWASAQSRAPPSIA